MGSLIPKADKADKMDITAKEANKMSDPKVQVNKKALLRLNDLSKQIKKAAQDGRRKIKVELQDDDVTEEMLRILKANGYSLSELGTDTIYTVIGW